tara:strand:- start:8436 stop:9344 length:909 start_codon:yes stop_codon:yes gene_type:complete
MYHIYLYSELVAITSEKENLKEKIFRVYKRDGFVSFLRISFVSVLNHLLVFKRSVKHKIDLIKIKKRTLEYTDNQKDLTKALTNACGYIFNSRVHGDIAEFGTCSARSSVALAVSCDWFNKNYADQSLQPKKNLHFFDSFEGFPEAVSEIDKSSIHVIGGEWGKGRANYLTLSQFNRILKRSINKKFFNIYKGWYSDTLKIVNNDIKFSLIHVDCDLYQSTIDALDPLFERGQISLGAILLFDDWYCHSTDMARGERRAFEELCDKYEIKYSEKGSYSRECNQLIINSYKPKLNKREDITGQ